MKNGKKPSVRQSKLMTKWRLNYKDWLVVKDTPEKMVIVHRHSGRTIRIIPKEV